MCVFIHAIYNRDGLLEKRPLRRYLGPFVLWSTWMNLKCSHLHNGTRTTCPDLEAQSGVADGEEEGREKRKEASHREGGRAHSRNDTSRNRGWLGPTGRDVSPRHAAASMTIISGTVRCPRAWLLGGSGRGGISHLDPRGAQRRASWRRRLPRGRERRGSEPFAKSPCLHVSVSRGRLCTPWRAGNGGDRTDLGQLPGDREASAVVLVTRG